MDFNIPTATDNSGTVRLLSASHVPLAVFNGGHTTVIYIFADLAGNTAACTFIVTVDVIGEQSCSDGGAMAEQFSALSDGRVVRMWVRIPVEMVLGMI